MTVAVFLHGVGGPPSHWRNGFANAGEVQGIETREIRYHDLVAREGEFGDLDLTPPELHGPAQEPWGTRLDYAKRQGKIRGLVHRDPTTMGKPKVGIPSFLPGDALVRFPALNMRDAGHYRYNYEIRKQVIERVGNELTDIKNEYGDRDVVLMAHSLGSVVALDTLYSNPIDLTMLLTFGSPLGASDYWSSHWQGEGKFPYGRLGGWLNVVNLRDPISWQRGISTRFPQAVDAYVKLGERIGGHGGYHDPATYLSSPLIAEALKAVDNLNANR